MTLSEKFAVPGALAALYDFVNSLDVRSYVERGSAHVAADELATVAGLEGWLRARELLGRNVPLRPEDHRQALALREALRGFVRRAGEDGSGAAVAEQLNAASAAYPLKVEASASGTIALAPAGGPTGLGRVLAELQLLAQSGQLDRLKMCGSDQCGWIFYDRSKPANRRWCSSTLCGNRQKTRAYRQRRQDAAIRPGRADRA